MKQSTLYHLKGDGSAELVDTIDSLSDKNVYWKHCTVNDVKGFLKEHNDIPDWVAKTLCNKEPRSRAFFYDTACVCVLNELGDGSEDHLKPAHTLRMYVSKKLVITVGSINLRVVRKIKERFDQGSGPKQAGDFILALCGQLMEYVSEQVATLDQKLDNYEKLAVDGDCLVERASLNELRRRIIVLRRHLLPLRDVCFKLVTDRCVWFDKQLIARLHEMGDTLIRVLEDVSAARDRSVVLKEEMSLNEQEKMNRRMYLLSVFTVIFLPISFIAGLLGVNVGGVPGLTNPDAFYWLASSLGVIGVVQYFFLKKKRWI